MENIYDFPKNELFNVREVVKKYQEDLKKLPIPQNEEEIKKIMKFSGTEKEFENLKKSVSLEIELSTEDSSPIVEFDPEKQERCNANIPLHLSRFAIELETSKELLLYRESIVGRSLSRRIYPFGKTEFNYQLVKNQISKYPIPLSDDALTPYKDVILVIRVYRPFRYCPGKSTYGPIFQQEFLVFGDQYLTELRDKITCNFNNRCIIEISSDFNQENPKPQTNPGFFFITDTFYNDTRDPNNPDYSLNIKKWLENHVEFKQTELKTAKMEKTKFLDLNLRLGYPQVYQHNGNCEHLFCFSSIQFLTKHDQLRKFNYPIVTSVSIQKSSTCNMCGTREYSYIVQESNRQLSDPAYLCQICLQNYHYIDGKKIGEFKLYKINEMHVADDADEDLEADENASLMDHITDESSL